MSIPVRPDRQPTDGQPVSFAAEDPIVGDDPRGTKETPLEALLAFDKALAAGADPWAGAGAASSLRAVHECQRLLEAVWPRHIPESPDFPRQFGRFTIVRELGRGAFGVVFLAEDPALRRRVALKVPRAELVALASIRRRFLREAEAASRLDHPNIAPVYEMGEEGPVLYIASAYCQGPTLADWLRQRTTPVPWGEAARLARVLAEAVAHAHGRGILHRDLKPGNILLQRGKDTTSTNGRGGRDPDFVPRICDFGLAKLLDEVSHETSTGLAIGSPPYMAPEQAAGRTREQGPATDIYALGVILYELLTGRPPLRGETDLETLRLVSDQDPASPRSLRPGLPRDLETICLKCLEKRPERRYAGAADLAEDVGRFLDGRPIRARRPPAWERAWKCVRRRPVHAVLAAAVATVVLGGLGGLEWARLRERRYNVVLREALERSRRSEAEERRQRELVVRHQDALQLRLVASLIERGERGPARSILDAIVPSPGEPDPRGFAWFYLDKLVPSRLAMVPAPPGRVTSTAYSPDGHKIALADDSNQLHLVDRETGQLRTLPGRHRFDGHGTPFFSPDGRILASLCRGVTTLDAQRRLEVKVWDVIRGEEVAGLPEVFGLVYAIAFSPDGRTLVTVEATGTNRTNPVRSWALSDDRKRLALSGSLRTDQLPASLTPALRMKGNPSRPFQLSDAVAVTTDAEPTAAVWHDGCKVSIYDTRSGYMPAYVLIQDDEVVVLPRNNEPAPYSPARLDRIRRDARVLTGRDRVRMICQDMPVRWATFSADGRTAAVFSPPRTPRDHGYLCLIDVGTESVLAEFPLVESCACELRSDGDELLVTRIDAEPRLWNIRDVRSPAALRGHGDAFQKEVWGLAFSPDGRTLVSAADDHTLKLWDVASGRERATLRGHRSLVTAVACSPDGALLASAGFDKTVRIWDVATGEELARLEGHGERVGAVAFSPDGRWLASGGDDHQVRLWDVAARWERPSPLAGHTNGVGSLAFSPDGKTLFSGSGDSTIRLWDTGTGEAAEVWPAPDKVMRLALSPDGRTLAAAHEHGDVTLWDVAEAHRRATLAGHQAEVFGLAFSPDGRTLASAGADKTVRLWDPVTAQEVLVLKGHEARVRTAAFSLDGTILASGSEDGIIRLWRAPGLPK
jgi:WD40 repeat protein/tRNA A-37 threonylcarbamoyl transferase component Bud32